MRTSEFTFKKTQVKKFKAISVDLTVQEAADLTELFGQVCGDSTLCYDLYRVLAEFVEKNGEPKPRFKAPVITLRNT